MKIRKVHVSIAIFYFAFLLIICPQEARGGEKSKILSAGNTADTRHLSCGDDIERQFEYAESLFKEGDYYRAITEYKRFIFFFPEENKAEKCYFKIGQSYFKPKKWPDADEA